MKEILELIVLSILALVLFFFALSYVVKKFFEKVASKKRLEYVEEQMFDLENRTNKQIFKLKKKLKTKVDKKN